MRKRKVKTEIVTVVNEMHTTTDFQRFPTGLVGVYFPRSAREFSAKRKYRSRFFGHASTMVLRELTQWFTRSLFFKLHDDIGSLRGDVVVEPRRLETARVDGDGVRAWRQLREAKITPCIGGGGAS